MTNVELYARIVRLVDAYMETKGLETLDLGDIPFYANYSGHITPRHRISAWTVADCIHIVSDLENLIKEGVSESAGKTT